jgi:hypothetical protein
MVQLIGLSQLASYRLSPSVTTKGTPPKTGRIHGGARSVRHRYSKAIDAGTTTSLESEPLSSDDDSDSSNSHPDPSSDDDSDSSNSHPDPSSDDDGCSSEAEQGRWSGLDEQRLLAYKKEGKS